jgi:hypothetical protein
MRIDIPEHEFRDRFVKQMLSICPQPPSQETKDYADMVWRTYWENEDQRDDGPEECAYSDVSYWEE